jgi:oligogalacturonide lyase
MNGEVVSEKTKTVFFQSKDSIFALDFNTKKERLVFVFPADFKSSISAVNADGTLLGGSRATDAEKEILRNNPDKSSFFNLIYEAHLPKTLFTSNVQTGQLNKIFTDSAWLNHVQFSSTDPSLLMFCHEGPWHKVNRIWTININTKEAKLMHKRTMDMEIAGHEWFSPDGKKLIFSSNRNNGGTRDTNLFIADWAD